MMLWPVLSAQAVGAASIHGRWLVPSVIGLRGPSTAAAGGGDALYSYKTQHNLGSSLSAANLVLHQTVERIHVGKKYGDIPRGIFVVRGENVVLLGEIVSEGLCSQQQPGGVCGDTSVVSIS